MNAIDNLQITAAEVSAGLLAISQALSDIADGITPDDIATSAELIEGHAFSIRVLSDRLSEANEALE